jgi:hypothetical protein
LGKHAPAEVCKVRITAAAPLQKYVKGWRGGFLVKRGGIWGKAKFGRVEERRRCVDYSKDLIGRLKA